MSLNLRLSVSILVPCLLVLLVGMALIIANARQAVLQEIDSSAGLLLQVLTAVTVSGEAEDLQDLYAALVSSLGELDDIRHLSIALLGADASLLIPPAAEEPVAHASAPAWFSRLVAPPPREYRRRLSGPGLPYAEIAIRADAQDEIAEAWQESRVALGLLVAFAALAIGLIFLTVGRALRPIDRILAALSVVERGEYRARLPQFELAELRRIAQGFNRMAEVLEAQRRENQELTKRSLAIQERERRYLAQELHDELGQSISAIKAMAVAIAHHHAVAQTPLKGSAESIVSVCNRIYDVVRAMMNRLRPAVVDELGLRLGLERAVDDWNGHHEEVFCRLAMTGELDGLGDDVQIGLYRIVQECLTNVARHAAASTVDVRLDVAADPRRLNLDVRDDGRGFDPARTCHGVGLPGMRERVESLGGEMSVSSTPGSGVEIRITIPLQEGRPAAGAGG